MLKFNFIIKMKKKKKRLQKVVSVPFFIPTFNLLRCKLNNFRLKCYIEAKNKIRILLQFFVKNVVLLLLLLQ